jgi:acetyl-CoA C-acetyltransferase
LGLPYPGGPHLSKLAETGDAQAFKLPRPLLHSGDLDFSFAGLKTAVLTQVQRLGDQVAVRSADLAAATQAAIVDVLVAKSVAALERTGLDRLVVAGGVESMSRAPYVLAKAASSFDRQQQFYDTTMGWRFTNKAFPKETIYSMGETAENVAAKWNINRLEQDTFAAQSQAKYQAAHDAGKFKDEIVPIEIDKGKGQTYLFDKDEHPRLSSVEDLAKLKPAFIKDGTVTAGNASGINDGAAATLVVSENMVKKHNLKPLARIVSVGASGVEPAYMGIGPVTAVRKALHRAGLNVSDIGLVELNEAFASQSLACVRDLDFNPDIVNVNGGAIAMGHPLGATGSILISTVLDELERTNKSTGLITLCVGGGMGVATIIERV